MLLDTVFCSDPGILISFRIIGKMIKIALILVPVIIVIFGIISLFQAILADDSSAISKAISSILQKVIIGICIMFIPSISVKILSYLDLFSESGCITCLVDANGSTCMTNIKTACNADNEREYAACNKSEYTN